MSEPDNVEKLIGKAKMLYQRTFGEETEDGMKMYCAVAPGRVNLIGEHTDYTGGFVFPMAISYSTVIYGYGKLCDDLSEGKCEVVSANSFDPDKDVTAVVFQANDKMEPFDYNGSKSWVNYVMGVVDQYLKDLLKTTNDSSASKTFRFKIAIAGDVPLGSGLSSSASMEVATATFLGAIIAAHNQLDPDHKLHQCDAKERALRCQTAENLFCNSPCGIMDQFVSSAAKEGAAVFIDCRSLEYEPVSMGGPKEDWPVVVVCNSNVHHSIAGGEYAQRVKQCRAALEALQSVHGNDQIKMLRDATLEHLEKAKDAINDDVIYKRARHVITENDRTQKAKIAFAQGDWKQFGLLMNASNDSMRDDYEVSCKEIDILTDLAQNFADGAVYGSRLTGGGFGGCTVTLVHKNQVAPLIDHLKKNYEQQTDKHCDCFESLPADGAREVPL